MMLKTTNLSALRLVVGMLAGFTLPTTASAEEIYKTVGKDGEVFYSNAAPASIDKAEVIEVFPEPPEERIIAAQQELENVREQNAAQELEVEPESKAQALQSAKTDKPKPPVLPLNPFIGLAPFL